MSENKNVAILIDVYNQYGGASKAAVGYAHTMKEFGYNSFIVCNNILSGESNLGDVYELNSITKCVEFLSKNDIKVIHYFKSNKFLRESSVFYKMMQAVRKSKSDVNVLITVCQQPSYGRTILTPFEIRNSDYIVFIDKTAYNDPLYHFIPKERKTWMYLLPARNTSQNTESDCFVKEDYSIKDDTIVFGRGSTLNKCPKDVIDIYDRIESSHKKKFVIVGVPRENNWLTQKIEARSNDDVITYPIQLYQNYLNLISSIDVFLYYLPINTFSSIDGSLISALQLGLPCVVYGPSAPKEVIIHGKNGFVAENKEDFVKFANMLANDSELREKIGRNARRMYFETLPEVYWKEAHMKIVDDLCKSMKKKPIKIPMYEAIKIYIKKNFTWVVSVLRNEYISINLKLKRD